MFVFFVSLLSLSTVAADAATFTVTTTLDNQSNGCSVGQCTLREAVTGANASTGEDTIVFQAGLTGTIGLSTGHLLITDSMTITGSGARTLSVSGNNSRCVFVVSGLGIAVSISGLTITAGNAQPILIGGTLIGDGGGILNTNGATLNLTVAVISGNSATSLGGGVATRALAIITTITNIARCLVSGNNAAGGGGDVSNVETTVISSSATAISNTTITNNTALAEGGGVSNTAGVLNLTNDTISHNRATGAGGGLINVAGVLVGIVYMRNTILAQNHALLGTDLVSSDGFGFLDSLGNNLIGNNVDIEASFSASVGGGAPQPNASADIVGSVALGYQIINPQLGAVQNNGGLVDTRALMAGSPAVDRGTNCVFDNTCGFNRGGSNPSANLTSDQRGSGFSRLVDGDGNGTAGVDIGAYEIQLAPTSASVRISGRVVDAQGTPVARATVRLTDQNGVTWVSMTNNFGYYAFENVTAGGLYKRQPVHEVFSFSARIVEALEDLTGIDFRAADENMK